MDAGGDILYRLNDRDELVYVNDAWGAFAAGNGGDQLAADRVLRRPLWDFVCDPTTRQLYRDLLARVRGGHPVRFTLRCDTPARRRLLEMLVTSEPGGAVEFRTRAVWEEDRPPQALLDPHQPRSDEVVRVCGWCKRVDVGGAWAEVEEAVARLRLFERPLLPLLTHGICEGCFAEMKRKLDAK